MRNLPIDPLYSPELRAAVTAMLTELTDAELLLLVPYAAAVKGEPRDLLLAELKTRVSPNQPKP
jgi:hypothetical protein